jgi:hypothetical protein
LERSVGRERAFLSVCPAIVLAMSEATMDSTLVTAMHSMTEEMMQMQAQVRMLSWLNQYSAIIKPDSQTDGVICARLQAVERQATIEQQQRTIDQLQSKIQHTEAANEKMRIRLSHNDEEPESATAKKRTQPQPAAAAMDRQHSQKRHKPGEI